METNLEPATSTTTTTTTNNQDYDDDSNCSTPYVSAPSSPGHRHFLSPPRHPSSFFFYSAPTSPMHYVLSSSAAATATVRSDASSSESFEFDFSSRVDSPPLAADELFLNGQIRPMKLRAHLSRPDRSRRTRSMSPMRNTTPFDWINQSDDNDTVSATTKPAINNDIYATDTKSSSASSSRCSSAGRSSKRWIFLKDFLRSKSEGRSNNKFWQNINMSMSFSASPKEKEKEKKKKVKGRSAHEMHYAANRAHAEEMRKKTYLPYRQGLLGCLGFNSKSYGAFHGFATALSSR